MMRAPFTVYTLLGAVLFAGSASAQTAEELKKAIDRLEQVSKELQAARDAFNAGDLRSKAITIDTKIDLIDKDIQDIKKDIRDIKRRLGDGTSTALRPDFDNPALRGQGRLRFINEFAEEMSVVVNGLSYRLRPGQERLIAIPPGDFTYQVLQLQRVPQERSIAANETRTVRIYPLP